MARIGELLVAAGELTGQQIEQALRAQVMWGGRIGTNLVELGYIDLDKLANALGKQYRMPAALARHFERADADLQRRFSADLAEKYSCVPLLFAGANRAQLIIAAIEPLPDGAVAAIAEDLGIEPKAIVQSVAGELRIRYHLERVYQIARSQRYLRSKGKTVPPFPSFEIEPSTEGAALETDDEELDAGDLQEMRDELRARLDAKKEEQKAKAEKERHDQTLQSIPVFSPDEIQELSELAILDDDVVAIPDVVEEDTSSGRERRRYVHMIDAESEPAPENSLGRISIKRIPTSPIAIEVETPSLGGTLGEATRAIRRSHDRDRVAELVVETLFAFMQTCRAGQLMVVRGDAAISWKGFNRGPAQLPEIAVPLDQPGLIPRVIQRNMTCRLPSGDLGPIDQLVLVSLGAQRGDLVIVPIAISGSVMCLLALATEQEAEASTAESIAAAAGAAFARLMRNASR
jgi:hypothetical protein